MVDGRLSSCCRRVDYQEGQIIKNPIPLCRMLMLIVSPVTSHGGDRANHTKPQKKLACHTKVNSTSSGALNLIVKESPVRAHKRDIDRETAISRVSG